MFLCQLYYPFETLRAPVLPKNIKPITPKTQSHIAQKNKVWYNVRS